VGKRRLIAATAIMVALAGIVSWVVAADSRGALPAGEFSPRASPSVTLTGSDAEQQRRAILGRAALKVSSNEIPAALPAQIVCRYLKDIPTGTSPKFDCVLDGGEIVKVKYSRNAEIHAEVAATRLLRALGYGADSVEIVPRLRCYGCPRYPFLTMQLLSIGAADAVVGPRGYDDGYSDFEWVSVERKLPGAAVETPVREGWSWWELDAIERPRADRDAFRLLAIFLAHWDNKSENQRLVCLDAACAEPLAMIQDVGATFGPLKVNLAQWRGLPVWRDRRTCAVSMKHLPFAGGTFPDATISEAGRQQLARDLMAVADSELRAIFAAARFDDFQISTNDERDLDAWTAAFRHRRDQVLNGGPCPA
jgi:hypothetical protein